MEINHPRGRGLHGPAPAMAMEYILWEIIKDTIRGSPACKCRLKESPPTICSFCLSKPTR